MKILLASIGTRGDMEPLLAIGEILMEKGHQVICAFPEQFKSLVDDSDMEFHSLGSKFIELLESNLGKSALGGSGSRFMKIISLIKLGRKSISINREMIRSQFDIIENENPDRIVHNGKAIYPLIWSVTNKDKTLLISPVPYLHFVKNHTHLAFNSNYGTVLNKLTFAIANWGLITTAMQSLKWLGNPRKITRKQIKKLIKSNRVVYTISPTLFSKPNYWKENLNVLGYHERNKTSTWKPSPDLINYLQKHERILLITFGSMTNPYPKEKSKILIDILQRNKIAAIINTASGGLIKPVNYDSELLYFVPRIPYEWILPKMYGVIHHGGSGTTHMALKYACATMIIPHIIDQFVWNKIIHKMGLGPKGIRIDKLNKRNLEPKILELIHNTAFKKKAEQIAKQMSKESFEEEIYQFIIA